MPTLDSLGRPYFGFGKRIHDDCRVREVTDSVLKKLGVGAEALFPTLGRVAARGIETCLYRMVAGQGRDEWCYELYIQRI